MKKDFIFLLAMNKYSLLLCLGLLMVMGCSEDVVSTDEELIPYFQLFADEAAERGIIVDYEAERIEGLKQNISQINVLGQCFRNEDKPKKIVVDIDYWDSANESDRQFLIFHELGHCFLNREHDDRKDADNVCVSIMHSTPQACDFLLTDDNKEAYFDELFQ